MWLPSLTPPKYYDSHYDSTLSLKCPWDASRPQYGQGGRTLCWALAHAKKSRGGLPAHRNPTRKAGKAQKLRHTEAPACLHHVRETFWLPHERWRLGEESWGKRVQGLWPSSPKRLWLHLPCFSDNRRPTRQTYNQSLFMYKKGKGVGESYSSVGWGAESILGAFCPSTLQGLCVSGG